VVIFVVVTLSEAKGLQESPKKRFFTALRFIQNDKVAFS